jgi:hypothetical protein
MHQLAVIDEMLAQDLTHLEARESEVWDYINASYDVVSGVGVLSFLLSLPMFFVSLAQLLNGQIDGLSVCGMGASLLLFGTSLASNAIQDRLYERAETARRLSPEYQQYQLIGSLTDVKIVPQYEVKVVDQGAKTAVRLIKQIDRRVMASGKMVPYQLIKSPAGSMGSAEQCLDQRSFVGYETGTMQAILEYREELQLRADELNQKVRSQYLDEQRVLAATNEMRQLIAAV